jgi:hypothetical protein
MGAIKATPARVITQVTTRRLKITNYYELGKT